MSAIDHPRRARPLDDSSPTLRIFAEVRANRAAVVSLAVFLSIALAALLAPLIAPQDPFDLTQLSLWDSRLPPWSTGADGRLYVLGTDDQGRDLLSAILYGLRISLTVALSATVIAMVIGAVAGVTAAYVGGRIDALIMRLVDFQLGFPAILLALILLAVLGRGADRVVIALVAVQWAYYARTVRSAALVEKNREYIEAAKSLGLSRRRILFRHLLPNCLLALVVIATVEMAAAVSLEAVLSFLGLGTPITAPSLGLLIANGYKYMLGGLYWISFFPGLALLVTIISVNVFGDQLRDILNPRLQR